MEDEEKDMGAEELVKHSLLEKAEISLVLDTYDDIFSDFDPRPYSQRALSDDFLVESKRAARDKDGTFDLNFMIPKEKRRMDYELVIKRRLREHFRKHSTMIRNEISNIKKQGIIWVVLGILLLIFATAVTYYHNGNIFWDLLLVSLEPAGWFLFWIGGEKIVYERREKYPELEFYDKMSRCEIGFHTY